jgi:LmbE family N-acetylglucosaminyl deacetylase
VSGRRCAGRDLNIGLTPERAVKRTPRKEIRTANQEAPKILLVVAHPDDEYYCAAAVYRVARELDGAVDQVVITNGEGGFQFAHLAERFYGVALADAENGPSRLPAIRKEEVRRAGRILGIREHYFLDQHDDGFTLDPTDALVRLWAQARILKTLHSRLEAGRYDYVFVLLPREETHGHHKAAAELALAAVSQLSPELRPVVLGVEPSRRGGPSPGFEQLTGFPRLRAVSAQPVIEFDRTRYVDLSVADSPVTLTYEIVVNWVIAEHKSQGMFQRDYGKHDVERFWLFDTRTPLAAERCAWLASKLQG